MTAIHVLPKLRVRTAVLAVAILAFAAGEANAKSKGFENPAAAVTATVVPHATASAQFFTINQVLAQRLGVPVATNVVHLAAFAPADQATDVPMTLPSAAQTSDGPFGLFGFRAPENDVWGKWRKAEADIDHDLNVMAQCATAPAKCTSRAAERFNAIIDAARQQQGRDRLDTVNRAVNDAVSYMTDMQQYGVADLWSSPLATFTTGHGDCEDYAIAKYVALKQAGVADKDLRLLLVRDQVVHEDHAVLAARQDGRWLILDNRFDLLPQDSQMWNFLPIYALDQQGVELLASPYNGGIADRGNDKPAAAEQPASGDDSQWDGAPTDALPLLN